MKEFEYTRGRATTNMPWWRPKGSLLNKWKRDFFKVEGVQNYQFWICGGAINEWRTWDTDIVVSGEIKNFKELENIMTSAMQIGFKYRQLIDINWASQDWTHFHTRQSLLHALFDVVIAYEIDVPRDSSFIEREQIAEGLWRIRRWYPKPKHVERLEHGIEYNKPIRLTPDLNFKSIIIKGDKDHIANKLRKEWNKKHGTKEQKQS